MNWLLKLIRRRTRAQSMICEERASDSPTITGITPGGEVDIEHDEDQRVFDAYRDDRGVVMIYRRDDGKLSGYRLPTQGRYIVKIECVSSAYRAPDARLN